MATPLPPPTPPTPGTAWKASDVLYIIGSGSGFFAGFTWLVNFHPEISAFLAFATPFLFWAASYASNKGD